MVTGELVLLSYGQNICSLNSLTPRSITLIALGLKASLGQNLIEPIAIQGSICNDLEHFHNGVQSSVVQ